MTYEIYNIRWDLEAKYRETKANRDALMGWSEVENPGVREKGFLQMGPKNFQTLADDPTRAPAMPADRVAEMKKRHFQIIQYLEDTWDAYDVKSGELIAKPSLCKLAEELDPGQHDIRMDVMVWSVPDAATLDMNYGSIHVRNLVRSVNLQKSRAGKTQWHEFIKEWPNGKSYFRHLNGLTPESRVIHRSALDAGHHLWLDDECRALLCTDEFKRRAEAIGTNGIRFDPCTISED